MGSISSGMGLISGMDHQSIVDQLIAIDARPRDLLEERIGTLDAQRTAYLEISARITALLAHVQFLSRPSSFRGRTANSSNPNALSATAALGTQAGAYDFVVRSLASTHQLVSRGFQSTSTPLSAGTLTIESAQARLNRTTNLEQLNGFTGVRRGSFRLTDSSGNAATVDLTDVVTLDEVIDRINDADVAVTATVRGDQIMLRDEAGGSGTMRVAEVDGGATAADLGFGLGNRSDFDQDGALVGGNLMSLSDTTPLDALNDGLGLRSAVAGVDFTMTVGDTDIGVSINDNIGADTRLERLNHGQGVRLGTLRVISRDGDRATVDLSGAETVSDVRDALQAAFDDDRLTVTLSGSRLIIRDSTTLDPDEDTEYDFSIEDIDGYAAKDLGIEGTATTNQINGRDILHIDNIADVLAAINHAKNNVDPATGVGQLVTATVDADGHGIVLQTSDGQDLVLRANGSSKALADLGFGEDTYAGGAAAGTRILGGLNTAMLKTLNGGNSYEFGTLRIEARGNVALVDVSGADTLAELVDTINQASADNNLGIEVGYDNTGTKLVVGNSDGSDELITISDHHGTFAEAVGLTGSQSRFTSDNLQRQYISEATRLEDLNNGRGVSPGTIRITNSRGQMRSITFPASGAETLQDVIDEINNSGIGFDINVEARINDTGDGLELIDHSGGAGTLKVEDETGAMARDLNIAGESSTGAIDGSYEYHVDVSGNDTLESLAERIGQETTLAEATLLNDGSAAAPYRLNLTSRVGGRAGELIISEDFSDGGFGMATLTRAADARVLFGGSAGTGVLLTSDANTFNNVVAGMDITVSQVSDTPVSVTVAEDMESVLETFRELVSDFNDAVSKIDDVSDYDPETEEKGVLLGESALRMSRNRLTRAFERYVAGAGGGLRSLRDIGVEFSGGTTLSFDEEKFREAYATNPDGVVGLLTDEDFGLAHQLEEQLKTITDPDGLIDQRTDTLEDQRKLLNERIEYMNERLDQKRARLLREFQVMETVLAEMQSQQNALLNLQASAGSSGAGLTSLMGL